MVEILTHSYTPARGEVEQRSVVSKLTDYPGVDTAWEILIITLSYRRPIILGLDH